jgi:adenosylhomocysteine nucleosidase
VDAPLVVVAESAAHFPLEGAPLTLVCALDVEERVARRGGGRAWRAGLGVGGPLPPGPLVSFGLAGALGPCFEPGTLLTARKVVDPEGATLWEGEPLPVPGALTAVLCGAREVVDEPAARQALAERTGAVVVDLESAPLAETGRLAGAVRAISDTPARPVGPLAAAARPDGRTDWVVVARSFLTQPRQSLLAALGARRALASLRHAAAALRPEALGG